MIRNYLKIAWRNLIRSKFYSVINILGLAAGMAVAMLIAFWIWDEVTYDRYHANHDRLAQVMTTFFDDDGKMGTGQAVCMPIGDELRNKFGSDFKNVSMASAGLIARGSADLFFERLLAALSRLIRRTPACQTRPNHPA